MKPAPLLPDAQATQLLAAMLRDGDPAREAWTRWTRAAGDPLRALGNDAVMARPLLPLLYDSVRRNALPVDREVATYLRSATVTESLRSRAYRDIVDELASVLGAAAIPFLLIKGGAVGALYYADPALRHAHDLEILVHALPPVRRALAASRFRRARRHFVHASGLPLRVHTRLFVPRGTFDERQVWNSRTLNASDALALALIHASRSVSRQSARWACDAHAIVRRGDVDWPRFTTTVSATGAAIPVAAQLRWLHDALDVPIPAGVRAALDARAAQAGFLERAIVSRGLDSFWQRVLR